MCALIIEGLFCVFRFNFRLSGKQQILLNIIIRMTTKHSVSGGGGAHTHTHRAGAKHHRQKHL